MAKLSFTQCTVGHIQQSRVLDARIAEIISAEGRKKALMFDKYTDNNTSACMSEMWKLKKSLFPRKAQTLPTAKINYQGRLVSEPNELTKLLGEEYGKIRLRKRPSHPLNIEGKKIRKTLLHLKINIAKRRITSPFSMEDLEAVLKTLKSKKARDPEGIDRTIFKTNLIGSNMKRSLLELFNKIKLNQQIPHFMRKATVTTIPKKGSKLLLKNERGIFLVNSVRSILMRLIYNIKNHIICQTAMWKEGNIKVALTTFGQLIESYMINCRQSVRSQWSYNNMTTDRCLMEWILQKPVVMFLIME